MGICFDQDLRENPKLYVGSSPDVKGSYKTLSIRNKKLTIWQEYFDIFIIFLTFQRTDFTLRQNAYILNVMKSPYFTYICLRENMQKE